MDSVLDFKLSNRQLRSLIKDEITSGDFATAGKRLPDLWQDKFVELLGSQTRLKDMVDFFSFRGVESQLHTIDLPYRVLTPQTELSDHRLRRAPLMVKKTLTPVWFNAKFVITDEALNINLADKEFLDVMISLMATAMNRDYEKLLIRGDKDGPLTNEDRDFSGWTSSTRMVDQMYRLIDGLIAFAKSEGTEYDISGWTDKWFRPDVAKQMLLALPEERKWMKSAMSFLVTTNAFEDFSEVVGDTGSDLGTIMQFILNDPSIKYHDKRIVEIPWMENYPKQVNAVTFSNGGTAQLDNLPIVSGSEDLTPNIAGTYFTPYVVTSDYTINYTTGVVEHAGTASGIPTDSETNITSRGSDIVVMMPPKNLVFAMNTGVVGLESDRVVDDAYDLYVARTSIDTFTVNGNDIVYASGLQNKTAGS